MSSERLHTILKDLQAELGAAETLSNEDRDMLTGVVDQIHSALGESQADEPEEGSILSTLDDAALHFEAEHPRLTETLYKISELFRSAGLT